MRRSFHPTSQGDLVGVESSAGVLESIATSVANAAAAQVVLAEPFPRLRPNLWLKGDHLPGSARWRHTFRRAIGLGVPRTAEFANLEWLRKRLFRCPRPVAAGVIVRAGVVRYQVLALEQIDRAATLETSWSDADDALRAAWIDELALEVARMHSLAFVHRDLFLRNVLVDSQPTPTRGDPRKLYFLDAWRSGRPRPLRDEAYDLGCLMVDARDDWSQTEQKRFFARYFDERSALGALAQVEQVLQAADGHRSALVARMLREPNRIRRNRAPTYGWDWRALRL